MNNYLNQQKISNENLFREKEIFRQTYGEIETFSQFGNLLYGCDAE